MDSNISGLMTTRSPSPFPNSNTHTPNMTSNIAPLYHIAPLTAPGMDLIDGDGGIKVDISTMMVEERRTRCQCWFVCTIACNILLEVRKLILSNKTNNENEVTLKEFTLYVLYYAAATLGGVDTYADGRNPPHGFPYYTNTELAKYLDNLSIPLDKAEGIVVEPIISMLTWKGLQALHYVCGPFDIEDLPMVAKTKSYYGLFQSYTHTDHHCLIIEMNLLDPKCEAIIIEGMEEIHGKFHSGSWFDPVTIQIVPNAHSMTNVVIFIDWIDGKAERAAIEKIVSDTREEDRLDIPASDREDGNEDLAGLSTLPEEIPQDIPSCSTTRLAHLASKTIRNDCKIIHEAGIPAIGGSRLPMKQKRIIADPPTSITGVLPKPLSKVRAEQWDQPTVRGTSEWVMESDIHDSEMHRLYVEGKAMQPHKWSSDHTAPMFHINEYARSLPSLPKNLVAHHNDPDWMTEVIQSFSANLSGIPRNLQLEGLHVNIDDANVWYWLNLVKPKYHRAQAENLLQSIFSTVGRWD
ncbi:hypothetical protein M422DRAFT_267261 [Sphaerobolus stellatus SS14]|uniref:Uncharacterized protein n=1 Tax=Sphaerobolus stellatus (strain SS14) TaxID=990650 RepID=A0A0C9V0W3_SPHS4|nr:hypothetical protein M422DRAFT_267261 [Sphaerobolus stellatus SS14]